MEECQRRQWGTKDEVCHLHSESSREATRTGARRRGARSRSRATENMKGGRRPAEAGARSYKCTARDVSGALCTRTRGVLLDLPGGGYCSRCCSLGGYEGGQGGGQRAEKSGWGWNAIFVGERRDWSGLATDDVVDSEQLQAESPPEADARDDMALGACSLIPSRPTRPDPPDAEPAPSPSLFRSLSALPVRRYTPSTHLPPTRRTTLPTI